jgi:predicted aminopeptidase
LDAYSTTGLLPDPVYSPMLRRDEIGLADVIIHELTHNTIYRTGDTTFNESLATFVGRRGAIDFLSSEFGADAAIVRDAIDRFEDLDRLGDFIDELHAELTAFFAQPISSEAKIAGREAVYAAARQRFAEQILPTLHEPALYESWVDLPTNNAWLLGRYRYSTNVPLFAAIFEATAGSWPAALAVYRHAASADDPEEYLQDWLAANP